MSQDALLAALRLSAGSPGAALALFQGDNWQARETLCQALAYGAIGRLVFAASGP